MALKAKPRSEMDTSDCSANQQSEDQKVDILECENPNDEFQDEEEEVLSQSSSSSFGDSMCGGDDDDDDDFGFEAQSLLSKNYPLPETCGGDGSEVLGLRKKKKVTDEWRRFCQPIMWRCKWLELKVKEIESQARGYDREVRSYYLSKQFDLEKSKLEGFDGKSKPYRHQTQRMNVFKRGKRKRVEETTDVAAYISNHNVFSYAEKRKPTTHKAQYTDLGLKATSGREDVIEDDCFVSGSDCCDDLLAKILCKIDEAQDKAKRLKRRVDQLVCESQAAPRTASPKPRTIARSRSDFTVESGKQRALVEEARNQTVQIGRQRISADHTEDLMIPQAPPFESDVQFLHNISPLSYGRLGFPSMEDLLLMDGPEMNDYEGEPDLDHCFMKLMNEFGEDTLSSEEDDDEEEEEEEEEDPTPVSKSSLCVQSLIPPAKTHFHKSSS